ncbi:MAG: putative transposase, partial [Cyclobacteriaceae bacterium]
EKMAPAEYAKINSSGASPRRIKNNNYIKVLEV